MKLRFKVLELKIFPSSRVKASFIVNLFVILQLVNPL